MTSPARDQVFISYSKKDKEWLEALLTHLAPYVRDGSVSLWETAIEKGTLWLDEIKKGIVSAKVAILLVSANYFNSPFIVDEEFAKLLAAAKQRGLIILWVPLSASSYEETEIAKYQAAHDPAH